MSDTSITPRPHQFFYRIPGLTWENGKEMSKHISALNISIGPDSCYPARNKRMHPHQNVRIDFPNEIHAELLGMWEPTLSYLFRCVRFAADPALRFRKDGSPGVSPEEVKEYLEDETQQFYNGPLDSRAVAAGSGWRYVPLEREVFKKRFLGGDVQASMWTDRNVTELETSEIENHGGVLLVTAAKWELRTARFHSLCRERTVSWIWVVTPQASS